MDRSLYRLHKSWGSGSLGYAATPAASQANFEFILAATFRRRASNKRSKTSIKRTQPRLARWRQKATPISNRPRVAGSLASLARLCRDQGRHAEARDLLAPVYGWFTEGFKTPDLQEAKALLDELA